MATDEEIGFPVGNTDERELLLSWLAYLRGAVLRDIEGCTEEQAHWTPDGALISLVGIVNHLTRVEWRWIDGGMLGKEVSRSEAEFAPGPELTAETAIAAYQARARRPRRRCARFRSNNRATATKAPTSVGCCCT